jgi:hypothetical protein
MSKAFPDEIESTDDIPEDIDTIHYEMSEEDESLLATEELESPSDT